MSTNQTSQEHIAFYNLKRLPAQLSQAFFFLKKNPIDNFSPWNFV